LLCLLSLIEDAIGKCMRILWEGPVNAAVTLRDLRVGIQRALHTMWGELFMWSKALLILF